MYPTALQQAKLNGVLGAARKVYNYFVEVTKGGTFIDYDQMSYYRAEIQEQNPWLRHYLIDTVLDSILRHKILGASRSLKTLKMNGHKTGRLSFKKSGEFNTAIFRRTGFTLDTMTGRVRLSKIGWISLKIDSAPKGKVVHVEIMKQLGKWFLNVCYVLKQVRQPPERDVAIDLGLDNYVYDSDGHSDKRIKFMKQGKRKLRLLSRRLSRCKRGSKNRMKAKDRLAAFHARMRRKRDNFLHNISSYYGSRYDTVFLEKLRVKNLMGNRQLSQSIADASWYKFKQLLSYKTCVVEVAPHFTSQDCSHCGTRVQKALSIRTHVCQKCDLVLDRDYNAAINILIKGRSDLARRTDAQSETAAMAATPVDDGSSATTERAQPVEEAGTILLLQTDNN